MSLHFGKFISIFFLIIYGNIKFLYVSPERLQTTLFIERAKQMKVCLIAIDGAHCISQWGYDFRPPYLKIAEFRALFPEVPLIALTATATKEVKQDILEKLEMQHPQVFQQSFARANLSFRNLCNGLRFCTKKIRVYQTGI